MTGLRSEDMLVGVIGLALLPMIALRIIRGIRQGRLPLYRAYLRREESETKFAALLGLHVISFILVGTITADLLLNLGLRDRL
jgi:hypothetical protein